MYISYQKLILEYCDNYLTNTGNALTHNTLYQKEDIL